MENSAAPSTFLTILQSKCPACKTGKITKGVMGMHRKCPTCGYDLHPEDGYYLGAMMVSFFVVSLLTIPPMIALKFSGASDIAIITYPFIQYLIIGPILTHYAKVVWAHIGFKIAQK